MQEGKKNIWEFFIHNRKFVFILCVAIVAMGLLAIQNIPKRSTPKANFPIVTISTSYPGAGPEDVEELVTDPIEDEVLSISKIDEISSNSYEGFSSITILFDVGADKDKKVNEVEDAVDRASLEFPNDANDPRVNDLSPSELMPVLRFSLSGPYDVNHLKDVGEDLKDELKRIPHVSEVNITGGEDRVFKVLVNKTSLDNFGLSLGNVTNAINSANSNIPLGSIQTGGSNYSVKLQGEIRSAGEIENIPIASKEGSVVYVRDVARVVDTFKEKESISRLSLGGKESQPAISMSIVKSAEGGSILDIVDKAKNKIEEAKGGIIPENVQIEIVSDQAESISNDISDLANNGLQTIIIIIVLLVLFVGWRESLLSAIGVPLTFLISFAVLNWAGYTMNFLTLFALVLSLGILVDNFIVITEGVNRKLRDGREVKQAVIETVREYHLPLTTGVLTTVFAFLPMLLTGGIVGEFIKALPITVTITLLAALFVSLGVLTGLSPKFLTLGKKKKNPDASDKDSSFFLDRVVLPYYTRLLNFFFRKGSHRIWLSIVLIILFAGALMLPIQGILKQDLFPEQDQDYFAVNIEEPVGTPLQQTSKTVSGVERLFLGDGRIESFQSNVGSKYNTFISNSPGGEHQAHILVNLKEDREQPSFEIAEEYRQKLGQKNFFPAEVNVVQLTAGPTSGSPVTINIIGPSLTKLDELGTKIKEELENTEGAVNVETSKKEASGKFSLHIDRAKAQMYGVTTNQVARILRNGIHGTEATVVRQGGEDTDVLVKYDLGDKEVENKVDISTISSLTIATPKGNIPLNAFTSVDMGSQRAFIQHQDGERILQVTSDSVTGVSPVVIADIMKEKIEKMNIPAEYKVTFGGEKEDIQESFRDMMMALLVGVLVIAMLMVLQFKSFRQPLFILLTIPLSIIGIFPGLVAVGQSLSFPAMIGLVGLAGIVVNNAILLIDAINRYRRNGQEKKQAILSASHIRFQPVLLTAATTVGAMIPLTFSNPTWSPIAYSIIFGLSFATVLTLVVIPILYFSWGETTLEEE